MFMCFVTVFAGFLPVRPSTVQNHACLTADTNIPPIDMIAISSRFTS